VTLSAERGFDCEAWGERLVFAGLFAWRYRGAERAGAEPGAKRFFRGPASRTHARLVAGVVEAPAPERHRDVRAFFLQSRHRAAGACCCGSRAWSPHVGVGGRFYSPPALIAALPPQCSGIFSLPIKSALTVREDV